MNLVNLSESPMNILFRNRSSSVMYHRDTKREVFYAYSTDLRPDSVRCPPFGSRYLGDFAAEQSRKPHRPYNHRFGLVGSPAFRLQVPGAGYPIQF